MPLDELLREGEHMMTVCNACRYCEEYCPVFPAMENRVTFGRGDLMYLANLCHNCGECLYACQYAPPHEFGIDLPRALARIRVRSYEDYCWPRALGVAFRRQGLWTSLGLATVLMALMLAATTLAGAERLWQPHHRGDFYAVVPHDVMVGLFGGVSLFVLLALGIGIRRFWRDTHQPRAESAQPGSLISAVRDVLTLRHLHGAGLDCTSREEERAPWRRWFHHCTFYGFLLCFLSTSVAAAYEIVLGWFPPYAYTSLPVVLGTLGGLGLLVGPAGLFVVRQRRDTALADPEQAGMDVSFIALLFLASLTGLVLLVLREGGAMGPLLIVHLSVVLALFVTLPYGKFVHGLYRTAALIRYAAEYARAEPETVIPENGETTLAPPQDSLPPPPALVPIEELVSVVKGP